MPYCPLEKDYIDECGECEMCDEDGDSEMWNKLKKDRQEKKAKNLESSLRILANQNIEVKKLSDYHFIVGHFAF